MNKALFLAVGALLLSSHLVEAQPVTQPFTFNLKALNLPVVRNGSVSWADVDGDGDLDVLLQGLGSTGTLSELYRNVQTTSGQRTFETVGAGLPGLAHGRAAWADLDADGDLDLALTGSRTHRAPYQPVTLVYRNDGGALTLHQPASGLTGLHSGALAWGDVDNDGDQDLLVSGVDADGRYRTVIGRNNGTGALQETDPGIPGFAYGEGRWGDFDADGDLDLLLSGATEAGFRTAVYRNANGVLTDLGAQMIGLAFASVDWGDYDRDGDLDVVVSGGQVTARIFEGSAYVYRNNGGAFTADPQPITGTLAGSITWGDYDNDGDLDLMSLGAQSALGSRSARIFRNNGAAGFEGASILVGAAFASADWGDFDGDGDLDLLTSGATSYGVSITNLYENERQVKPTLPLSPGSLAARESGESIVLEWAAPTTDLLTYDVRIGTRPGLSDVRSVPADPQSGLRLLGRPGAQVGTSAFVRGLPPGDYYWSVQAVGPAFLASGFSHEAQFTVSSTGTASEDSSPLPTEFSLSSVYPNPFQGQAVVRYDVPRPSRVTLTVYDVLGRRMAVLVDRELQAGSHEVVWGPDAVTSVGVYLLEMHADGFRSTRTLTRVR